MENGNVDRLFKQLKIDRQSAIEMFVVFARFEYALKSAGYLCRGKRAAADWRTFADDLPGCFPFDEQGNLAQATQYLLDNPPRNQVVETVDSLRVLAWAAPQLEGNKMRKLLDVVNGVRNNLFHGGKFPPGSAREPGRDSRLIQSCLTILYACLSLSAQAPETSKLRGVHEAFWRRN